MKKISKNVVSSTGRFIPVDFRPVVRAILPKSTKVARATRWLCNRLKGRYYSYRIAASLMAHLAETGLGKPLGK